MAALKQGKWEPSLFLTSAPGDARTHMAELAQRGEPAPVVVLGGDGTLHEAVNGLADAGFPEDFPLVPRAVGTGNDFHRMLRGDRAPGGLLRTLQRGKVRLFDVGKVEWEGGQSHFVNLLGVGIDVEVLRLRERYARLPGLLQYGVALITALRSFETPDVSLSWVEASGAEAVLEGPVLLSAITVGPTVGGGFVLAPSASPEDGLLDLFLAQPMGVAKVLRHLPGVIRGTDSKAPEIRRVQFASATLRSRGAGPLWFEMDGERIPVPSQWFRISLVPSVLPVLDG